MESSIPYIVLGLLYAYLLYLSWTPETIRMIFASKYLLPEVCLLLHICIQHILLIKKRLNNSHIFFSCVYHVQLPSIAKMFSSEMTLASAWIHLLVVDLFAARSLSLSVKVSVVIVRADNF